MIKYKEIQPQTYLELDSGKVYFAIEEVLRIINYPAENYPKNSISPSKLNKLLKKNNIVWHNINRQQTMLLTYYDETKPDDSHAASLTELSVLSSTDITKLLILISRSKPTKNGSINAPYKELEWGIIVPRNNDTKLYYSIDRVTYDIQGYLSLGHKDSPAININSKTVSKKAKQFSKEFPNPYEVITVPVNQINFTNSKIHANRAKLYVNLNLHDKLLSHYKHQKGVSLKKETANLKSIIGSTEPLAAYIRKNLKQSINGNSDAYSITLSDSTIRAIDKSIGRKYKEIQDYSLKRFAYYDNEINSRNVDINKYNQMRGSLKHFLNNDYYNKVISAGFKDQFLKDSLKRQIENIINIY